MATNQFVRFREEGRRPPSSGPCVFISHKSEDKTLARAVAKAIIEMGVDIYFDENDKILADAAGRGDDVVMAACIEDGLDRCTHLLGLLSSRSFKSWWIPYEIGGATGRGRQCAHLVAKEVKSVPSFIKLSRVLADIWDLEQWIGKLVGKSRQSVSALVRSSTSMEMKRFLAGARTDLRFH